MAREWARKEFGNFVEVYVKCPIEVCRQRDVKGLYKLVDEGKLKGFTGIDDPYEEPEHPELIVETDKETVEESISRTLTKLGELGYLEPEETKSYTANSDEYPKVTGSRIKTDLLKN
jgi:adenylylsulfate kinase-like enzyme